LLVRFAAAVAARMAVIAAPPVSGSGIRRAAVAVRAAVATRAAAMTISRTARLSAVTATTVVSWSGIRRRIAVAVLQMTESVAVTLRLVTLAAAVLSVVSAGTTAIIRATVARVVPRFVCTWRSVRLLGAALAGI